MSSDAVGKRTLVAKVDCNLHGRRELRGPETLGAAALKVAGLEQLAVDVVPSLQDHEVQVNLVAAVPVLPPQCVGARVRHLGFEDLQDGSGATLVLLRLHLVLVARLNLATCKSTLWIS